MNNDKRHNKTAIPGNLEELLNSAQQYALRQIENFGWQLEFVRQPVFQDPVAVVVNSKGDQIGILEADGRINMQADITLRAEQQAKKTDSGTG
ncbi:MAG: hypothetical protein WBO57_01225 [Gammaproteobacteria bacterium]